jgi:hypothetical protein
MRWCELYEQLIFNIPDHQGTRRIFMTSAFQKDYSHFKKYSGANVPKILRDFLLFKQTTGIKPIGPKDAPMGHGIAAWHCHLVHGKVIVLYAVDDTHIELYRILEHADYDSPKQTMALKKYVAHLHPSDFVEYILPPEFSSKTITFSPEIFSEIEEMIYTLTQNTEDREILTQFATSGSGLLYDVILEMIGARSQDTVEQFLTAWKRKYGHPITEFAAQALRTTNLVAAESFHIIKRRPLLLERAFDIMTTPQFKQWFSGSKVVDKTGKPLLCFHGSAGVDDPSRDTNNEQPIQKFHPWTHFGTVSAANARILDQLEDEDFQNIENRFHIYPVFLSIKRPVVVDDFDTSLLDGNFELLMSLHERGYITRSEMDHVNPYKIILQHGDGLVYENEFEDAGSTSWVISRSDQVWSMFGDNPN